MIQNKRILVTGGAGSIGAELVSQLAPENKIYILDQNETAMFDLYEEQRLLGFDVKGRVGDIRDRRTVEEVCESFKPEYIFHVAALKHVTPAEHYPDEAVGTNVIGTINLVKAAHKYGVEKFINISSDKAVNPNLVYGCTKRLGELIVKNAGYVSVRFGNVLGSRGSVVPIWQKQIDEGRPLTITDERMERYFMSIEDACNLVIKATEIGNPGEIMVMNMGKPVNVLQAAKEVLNKLGKQDYPIKTIGVRPGETLSEKLMTDDETQRAEEKDGFYIIR
jgi:FlaA1/EpsC-like NDP-sugar epimerase